MTTTITYYEVNNLSKHESHCAIELDAFSIELGVMFNSRLLRATYALEPTGDHRTSGAYTLDLHLTDLEDADPAHYNDYMDDTCTVEQVTEGTQGRATKLLRGYIFRNYLLMQHETDDEGFSIIARTNHARVCQLATPQLTLNYWFDDGMGVEVIYERTDPPSGWERLKVEYEESATRYAIYTEPYPRTIELRHTLTKPSSKPTLDKISAFYALLSTVALEDKTAAALYEKLTNDNTTEG